MTNTTKIHSFDLARTAKVPGTIVTFSVNAQRASVRVRNAARRMLVNGVIDAGWSSKARRLAETFTGTFEVPHIYASGYIERYGDNYTPLPDAVCDELVELAEADWVMYASKETKYGNLEYHRGRTEEFIRKLRHRQPIRNLYSHTEVAVQARAVVAGWLRTDPIYKKRLDAALAAFDSGAEIETKLEF